MGGRLLLFLLGILGPGRTDRGFMMQRQGMLGIFSGYGLLSTSLIILSSTVLAGIRRATGWTLKPIAKWWPPIDPESGKKCLRWYDEQMAKLNKKAESHITKTIEKIAPTIPDPAVRQLWISNLRVEMQDRLQSIRKRRETIQHMVDTAEDARINPLSVKHKRHPPLLAAYLFVGEWLFDFLVGRIASCSYFWQEPDSELWFGIPQSIQGNGVRRRGTAMTMNTFAMFDDSESIASSLPAGAGGSVPPATAYIATSAAPVLMSDMPVPSAPDVSTKEEILIPDLPCVPQGAVAGPSTVSDQVEPRNSVDSYDPPPYTLVAAEESEQRADSKH